jgi:VWFA-related protein
MIFMPLARAVLAVLLLLAAALAVAQEPAPDRTFSDTVDVRLAEVEVLVSDRDGKPVPGLTREDFRVLEDGQPVEVTHLSSTDLQPLVVAVFIDDASLSGPSRAVAYRGLRTFLNAALKPGDRALVVRFDGSLELQGEPTGDLAALTATVDRLGRGAAPGIARMHERVTIQQELVSSVRAEDAQDVGVALAHATAVFDNLRAYGRARADSTRDALQAIQQTLALLSTLPERKALVYVGGGLPLSPGADLFDLWMDKYAVFAGEVGASPLEISDFDASRLLRDTAERANAAGITLHALALPATVGATISARAVGGARVGWDPEDTDRAMRTLAAATGGRVMTEVQNPAPFLEATARDLASTYVLGYTPAPGGGKKGRHKIEVTVRDGALRARFREERIDGQTLDPLLRRALAALWAGEEANPLRAELSIEEQTQEEDGRFRVTAVLAFPLASVFFQPHEHFHIGHLTLAIAVRDGKGRISGTPRAEVPIEIPNQRLLAAPGQSAGYRFTVHLSPGESLLAVAMRDDLSGAAGVIRTTLDPAQAGPGK